MEESVLDGKEGQRREVVRNELSRGSEAVGMGDRLVGTSLC